MGGDRSSRAEREALKLCRKLCWEVRELDVGFDVPRLPAPHSALSFYRDFVAPNKPAVFMGCLDCWPALSRWSLDYLKQRMGESQVTVAFTPDGWADAVTALPPDTTVEAASSGDSGSGPRPSASPSSSLPPALSFALPYEERMPFSRFLDVFGDKGRQERVAYLQQQNNNFAEEFPQLAHDVQPGLPWAAEAFGREADAVNLWIGDDRSVTSFHKDHYENLYCVLSGTKRFTLLPPCDTFRMGLTTLPVARYEQGGSGLQLRLQEPPCCVRWCPLKASAALGRHQLTLDQERCPLYFDEQLPSPLVCTVKAGEVLYLPSLWWHQVEQQADEQGKVVALNYWYDMHYDVKYAYAQALDEAAQLMGLADPAVD